MFVRCVGDAPLRVTVEDRRYRTPCDGRARRVTPAFGKPGDRWLDVDLDTADPYTAVRVTIARRG